ncbi:FIST signal transduction protein [Mesorhizobium sp. M1060]|uniref:FIST signal transduction protein n=1 Tax=unclassified Mesorhizobium TaxID=325217 RepID=UPI0004CF6F22|nr:MULTISPECIES: FIST signal transduction protein [unclassified Mesorhizobium]WJI48146.1 FIST signal transduction protein [Mesorhizobium sp. C120A]WJI54232.1 FIST signal transduction protein [Mesorhizobium sp. C089B]
MSALTTDEPDADAFARAVAAEAAAIDAGFALLFFSQSLLDASVLSQALKTQAPTLAYAACSTAGEITPQGLEEGHVLAMLFPSASFSAVSTMVDNLSSSGMDRITDEVEALRRLLRGRTGSCHAKSTFALCFIDGLSFAEEAVTSAIHWGLDDIPLIGGSAGDDLKFETTRLISNGKVASDSAIIVLIATEIPFHVFKTDNFIPTDEKLVVTASDPDHRTVREFNATNAAEEYAASVGIVAQNLTPMSFASHPVVVKVGGEFYCRSIQKMHPDGSLSFFCAIDDGVVLSIAQPKDMVESTRAALRDVEQRLGGIDMILGFDCVLRRLDARNRQVFRDISELYRVNNVIGFGTYGEQYRSMHLNQTFTGIAFGERQAAE